MRRKRLRAALLLVVAAALGGIGYLVSRNVAARRTDPWRELGADFLPQVAQRIQNFRRVKVKDGRTVWQVTAKDAQYFEKSNQIVVREPRMTLYLEGSRGEAVIAGDEGHLVLDGKDLQSLTLRGKVSLQMDEMELDTDEATYDRAQDLLTAPGQVTIRGRTLEVQGRGMRVNVGPQLVHLLDDVRTVVRSDAGKS